MPVDRVEELLNAARAEILLPVAPKFRLGVDRDVGVVGVESEADIRNIKINRQLLDQINLDPGGIIITAKGSKSDFVSRFFTPQASIFEDPVTGSAHCTLIPYWSEQLGKKEMVALQLSDRVGKLYCVDQGESVLISGYAKTYSVGEFWTE